jgi:hypothetical protein
VNPDEIALLIVVWIPLLVVWAIVLVDIVRRPDLGRVGKVLWSVACTLLWPALIAYLLLRPTRGRLEDPEDREDPHARLVTAVLLHEAGGIDDAEMDVIVRGLRLRVVTGNSRPSG